MLGPIFWRRLIMGAVAYFAVAALPLAAPAQASARATIPAFGAAVKVLPPSNASNPAVASLLAVSCTDNRACVVGGTYKDSAGHTQAMVVTQVGAGWTGQTEIRMPADAAADPMAGLSGISCWKQGYCAAVGYYRRPDFGAVPFVAMDANGKWGTAFRPALPGGVQPVANRGSGLRAVSCTSAGFCEAVGNYWSSSMQVFAMVLARSPAGKWSAATRLTLPKDAVSSQINNATGVACTGTAACVMVGEYVGKGGRSPFGLTQAGQKQTAVAIASPAGQGEITLNSVACAAPGNCLAVGSFWNPAANNYRPLSLTIKNGVFGQATPASAVLAGGKAGPVIDLFAVSCVASGPCAAVGYGQNNAGNFGAVTMIRTGTTWKAAFVGQPATVTNGAGLQSALSGVSCAGTGHCTAAGDYAAPPGGNPSALWSEATSTG